MFFVLENPLSIASADTKSVCHDGALTMMSQGLSSLLFTFRRKQCNLSERKRLQSIEFSLQLCFHTAMEEGCGALMNETLTSTSPLPSSQSWVLSAVTVMMRERQDEFVRRDLIFLTAKSVVNSCLFCHCRFQAVSRVNEGGKDRKA